LSTRALSFQNDVMTREWNRRHKYKIMGDTRGEFTKTENLSHRQMAFAGLVVEQREHGGGFDEITLQSAWVYLFMSQR